MNYDKKQLVARAIQASENAYAPYSHFHVGAAVLTASGEIFVGCNVENATYGATICAERVAVSSAVAAGHRELAAIAIAGSGQGNCFPCGICRQVLCEFDPAMEVLCVDETGAYRTFTAAQLLPETFTLAK